MSSETELKRHTLLIIAIGLIAIIAASSLIIYENGVLNPEGSRVLWQRPIENFATALAADTGKVFTMDISGNVNCFVIQTGKSVWNGSSVGGYFAAGLTVADGRVYGGSQMASVGCLDETNGQFQWSFIGQVDSDLWTKKAPDNIIVKDGRVFAIDGGVSVHNATTGEFLWQARYSFEDLGNITDSQSWWVSGFPLGGNPFEGNMLYAIGGNVSSAGVFKLNTDDGSILWRANQIVLSGSVLATYQGQVIIESGNQILSLNETSGKSLWSIDVGASIYPPTDYEGILLFGASDGNFYALNLAEGTLAWKTKIDSQNLFSTVNDTNTLTTYPIQIDAQNHRLFWSFGGTQQLGTTSENKHDKYLGTLCSIDLASGNVVWARQIEDSGVFYSNPAGIVFSKDTIFLTENNALWIFSASTGNLARNQHFDHYVLPPVVSGDEVFVAADLQLTAYG
jgi:outer membrane protein assembly factor BamB